VVETWNLLNLVHQYDQGIMELNLVHSHLCPRHTTPAKYEKKKEKKKKYPNNKNVAVRLHVYHKQDNRTTGQQQ
jgi:hypothetical protein